MKNAIKDEKPELKIDPNTSWLNQKIDTLDKMKDWILTKMGYPLQTVEIEDNQLNSCIGDAIRVYTKYATFPEQYITFNTKDYIPEKGFDTSKYKIMSVKDIAFQRDNIFGLNNDMFFGPYAFLGQGQGTPFFGFGNGNYVGAWPVYHNMHEYFDMVKRMCGSNPDWVFDKISQTLRLMPAPRHHGDHYILVQCEVEFPMEEYYGNDTVLHLALAEAKMIVGTVRKKFSGTQLLGGASLDVDIYNEGKEERDKILEELASKESIGQCFFLS